MPTENKPAEPSFDLNTSEGGRGFIANLFVTVLRRHDFTTYIKERLAADFACTLSKFIACAQAREAELQLRMNAADQRIDELTGLLSVMTTNYAWCLEAGYDRITSLGGDCDSVEKMLADNPDYAKAIASIRTMKSGAAA